MHTRTHLTISEVIDFLSARGANTNQDYNKKIVGVR